MVRFQQTNGNCVAIPVNDVLRVIQCDDKTCKVFYRVPSLLGGIEDFVKVAGDFGDITDRIDFVYRQHG
jgi:hypothetical protein